MLLSRTLTPSQTLALQSLPAVLSRVLTNKAPSLKYPDKGPRPMSGARVLTSSEYLQNMAEKERKKDELIKKKKRQMEERVRKSKGKENKKLERTKKVSGRT